MDEDNILILPFKPHCVIGAIMLIAIMEARNEAERQRRNPEAE